MSTRVCCYFQVHQPYRLRDLRITELGTDNLQYFDAETNRRIFRKVAEKCYLPTNALLLKMLKAHPDFFISFSLSGVFLDQCKEYGPDVLKSFQALAKTGQVEFLAETYEHSLSALKSTEEFVSQVKRHTAAIKKYFGQTPKILRNTELIYSNELAQKVRAMGFRGMLAEGVNHLLNGRSPNHPYIAPRFKLARSDERIIAKHRPFARSSQKFHVLLKHHELSDDIAFRFSNRHWKGFPLTADQFAGWMREAGGHCVNLFMDFETFGEHQWADSGIFEFLAALPAALKHAGLITSTPSQVLESWRGTDEIYDAHKHTSWADTERDLSAWLGNTIQQAAIDALYELEAAVKDSGDASLVQLWRRLQTSDHLYYMCTKYWADGDVHKYFSPYDSPYEAYRRFSHALCDLRLRLAQVSPSRS